MGGPVLGGRVATRTSSYHDPHTTHPQPTQSAVSQGKERERRFLVTRLPPNLDSYPHSDIVQGYIAIERGGNVVRVRKDAERYILNIKGPESHERDETEVSTDREGFLKLLRTSRGRIVEKTRYRIPYHDLTIELDIFKGPASGRVPQAEVEFKTPEQEEWLLANKPDWFGKDVTFDRRYSNPSLAQRIAKGDRIDGLLRSNRIPEFNIDEGLEVAKQEIERILSRSKKSVVVGIAGCSASGKSSRVAAELRERFPDSVVISMDDYYKGVSFLRSKQKGKPQLNFDVPYAVDFDELRENINELAKGNPVTKPVYSFATGERSGKETVRPAKLIIVEGIFALSNTMPELYDYKIFTDITLRSQLLRRLIRDIERTSMFPIEILRYFFDYLKPTQKLVVNTKPMADIILINEFNPVKESAKLKAHQVQKKFPGTVRDQQFRKIGAEYLATTEQVDYYLWADMSEGGAGAVRVREEMTQSGHNVFVLTIKGQANPKYPESRPTVEMEIDLDLKQRLIELFGEKPKALAKERKIYYLRQEDIIITVDELFAADPVSGSRGRSLGSFVEFRCGRERTLAKATEIAKQLGLDTSKPVPPYYESLLSHGNGHNHHL